MSDFVYSKVIRKIKQLLQKIREVGVPKKANAEWLKSIGFKSSNDPSLLGVLKYISFIDSNSIPTSFWNEYRGANHRAVLGKAIREGYAELFAVYPDANQQSQGNIEHIISTKSSNGKQVIAKILSTFRSLVAEADFSTVNGKTNQSNTMSAPPEQMDNFSGDSSFGPALHIDIQIHISPEASLEQIDKIFASMSKHLYVLKKSE